MTCFTFFNSIEEAEITNGPLNQSVDLDDDSCEEFSNQNASQSESQSEREEAPVTSSKTVRISSILT